MRCAAFRWTRPSPVDGSRAAAHAGSAHRAAPRAVTAAPKSKQRSIRFYERRVVAHSAATGPSATSPPPPPQEEEAGRGGTAARPASATGTDSGAAAAAAGASPRMEAQQTLEQYKIIYDRLIKIFEERPRDDWKKLIVFSKQWAEHSQGVFDRIKELSEKEGSLERKMALRKMFRTLQGVNDEVNRYNLVLAKLSEAAEDEWEPIVAVYRGDLQKGFFEHMQCLIAAAKQGQGQGEGEGSEGEGGSARYQQDVEALILMNTRLVALVSNHDSVAKDQDKLAKAAEVYRDLLSSISSLEDAEKKMAELGSQGKIDPAFLQISAKAYGAARDTNMRVDEAKWVAYKLYRNAKDQFERRQPPEKRIVEYLCCLQDEGEILNQLDKAVTPGPTRYTETHDYLWTTPQKLYRLLDETLKAYDAMRNAARSRLNTSDGSIYPRKVRIMKMMRDALLKKYM